ncbi:MAG: very short patch repair endonuclease [Candidatus Yanofskybacteria bacterium]|nr:very short patch repair endonuclease [Candidatus Yanofskybacteria bacterium]
MSRIRGSNTEFEKSIFREIKRSGISFKRNYRGVIGNPDIALPKIKKAVFLHSDFWHGWQLSRWEKVLPNDFWKNKLQKNRTRDRMVIRKLRRARWKVLTVWEHQLARNPQGSMRTILKFLKNNDRFNRNKQKNERNKTTGSSMNFTA